MIHYGQADSEKLAEEKKICRQILQEIHKFGITQHQQKFLIYLLALELEDVELMKELTSIIRSSGDDAFISPREEPEDV